MQIVPSSGGDAGPSEPAGGAGAAPDPAREFTAEEIEVLQELSARRRDLLERERQLALREGLLNAAEQRIESRINEMLELRGRIEGLVRQYNDQEEVELLSVVKIYETMKPKEAAQIPR